MYQRRVRLAFYFAVIFVAGALIAFLFVHSSPKSVQGTLGISFRGIDKGEYPSGKRFNVEDFRSPDLLMKALADFSIPEKRVPVQELAAYFCFAPNSGRNPEPMAGTGKGRHQEGRILSQRIQHRDYVRQLDYSSGTY
jgi:hypothetical protein